MAGAIAEAGALFASKLSNCISPVLAASTLKQSEQMNFEVPAVDLVTSSEFVSDLSGKVGVSLEGETKDQFVHRAKSELHSLLMQQLLIKKKALLHRGFTAVPPLGSCVALPLNLTEEVRIRNDLYQIRH